MRMILLVLSGAVFLEAADMSMMGVALPDIRDDLGMSTAGLQWVVSAYVLGYGGFVLLGGRLGDLLGRRRLFLIALTAFVAFSGLGGLAQEGWVLILSRFVTGLAAAFMTPVALSILTTTIPEGPQRTRALMVYAGLAAGGFSVGLVAGGLLTAIDWRWTFFAPVILSALLLVAAVRVLPRDAPAGGGAWDLPGAGLLTATMLLLVYAVVESPEVTVVQTALVAGAAVVTGAAFVAVERRAAAPIVRLGLLTEAPVARANVSALLWAAAFVSFQFVAVLYLQELRDWSPVETGVALLPVAIDAVLAPLVTHRIVARFGTRPTVVAGIVLGLVGYALLLPIGADSAYAAAVLPTLVLVGLGFTLVYGPLTTAATDGVSEHEQGLASGVFYAAFQFGAALGLAVVTAVVVTAAGPDPLDAYRAGFVVPVAATVLALGVMAGGAVRRARERDMIPA